MRRIQYPLLFLFCLGSFVLWGCSETATIPVTGTIYGVVVNPNGSPAESVMVIVEDGDDELIDEDLFVYTDAQGQFVINDVPSVDTESIGKIYNVRGEGEVEVYLQGNFQLKPGGFIKEAFAVPGQQAYDMGTLVLQETVTLWGKILLEDKDEYDGDHSGSLISIEGYSFFTVTRSDGTYYMSKLPPHDNYTFVCEHVSYEPLRSGPFRARAGVRSQPGVQGELQRLDD